MTILGNIYAIIAILMWGALALLAKEANDVPPFLLLAVCFFIAALIMPLLRVSRDKNSAEKYYFKWREGVIGGSCLLGFHGCYFIALNHAPVIEVSLISYLWPMFLALLVAKQGKRLQSFIGGCVGLCAVSIVLGWDNLSFGSQYIIGYMLALSCAVIWTFYSWYLSNNQSSSSDMSWQCMGVAMGALVISVITESWAFELSCSTALAIVLLGLGPVGSAFYLWDAGLKQGDQLFISSLSFSTPLLSAIFLSLFGYVVWSSSLFGSITLLIIAAVIINFKSDVQIESVVK